MAEPGQNEPGTRSGDIAGELRELGKNLADMLRSAWESEERKRLQDEIQSGLNDLGDTLNQAKTEFETSETGQRFKKDVEDIGERIRSGEMETKIREEILSALRTVNQELEKTRHPNQSSDKTDQGG